MAYDSPSFGRHEVESTEPLGPTEPIGLGGRARYRGQAGFRDEPDFRPTAAYQPGSYAPAGNSGYQSSELAPDLSQQELERAFDEPDEEDGGRDRLAVHYAWEALLLLGVAALGYLLWSAQPDALRGDQLSTLLIFATGFGLLGLGAGITLRAAAPNLAIGPVAAASGAYFADRGDEGVVTPTVFALAAAVLLGLALAALVVIFHVPGWAASLAAAAAPVVWLQTKDPFIPLTGSYDPTGQASFLFAMVAAVGILGGLLGSRHSIRSSLGRSRPIGDPARRRGAMAAVMTSGAIVLSMVFAVVAGVLITAGVGEPAQGSVGVHWLEWTLVGLGVALIGGTSAFGRKGGVFGTTFAVIALVLFSRYQLEQGWDISPLAIGAGAVAGGLVVTRLVETFGRPRLAEAGEPGAGAAGPWQTTTPAADVGRANSLPPLTSAGNQNSGGWPSAGTDSWSSALPARPAPSTPDPWDDRWQR
jgi:hypothetical protein